MERMKWKQYQEPLTTRVHTNNHTVQSPAETAATAELPAATAAASTAATSVAPQIPVERQTSTEYDQQQQKHNDQPVEEQKITHFQQQKSINDLADTTSAPSSSSSPTYGQSNGTATDNNNSQHNLQYEQTHERTLGGGTNAEEQQQNKGNTQQSNCVEDSKKCKQDREVQAVTDNTTTSHNHNQLHRNNSNSITLNNKTNCGNHNGNNNNNNNTSIKVTNSSHTNTTTTNITSVNANQNSLSSLTTSPPSTHPPQRATEAFEGQRTPTFEPVDWKPNEKCYFCVDGRLLTVNAKGELVAEPAGPIVAAVGGDSVEHVHRLETDSDSNESAHANLVNSTTTAPVVNNNNNNSNSTNNINNNNNNNNNNRIDWNKLLTTRLVDLPANMTSMDSMAAQLAVISGYPNFNWLQLMQQQQQQEQQPHPAPIQQQPQPQQQHQQQQQQQQQHISSATPTTSETSAAAVSPPLKDSPSPSDATGEQPLDLSSKPSPNSSISGDLKSVRSKTMRATPTLSSRRPCTDDALSSAVQEFLSEKYNTRKSSDHYAGSSSTSPGRARSNRTGVSGKRANAHLANALLHGMDVDKDMSGDECSTGDGHAGIAGGHGSNASTPQPETATHTALEELANRLNATHSLRKYCVNNGTGDAGRRDAANDVGNCSNLSPKSNALYVDGAKCDAGTPSSSATPQPQQSPPAAGLDPTLAILQAFLFTLTSFGALQQRADQPVTLRDLVANLKDMLETHTAGDLSVEGLFSNGKPNIMDQPLLAQKLQQQTSAYAAQRLPKSDTPETTSSLEHHEPIGDDLAASILKIPSYKPVAGTPTPTSAAARASCSPSLLCNNSTANSMPNPNGDSPHSAPSPRIANSMLAAAVAAASNNGNAASAGRQGNNDLSVISPPLMQHRQSPPSFSFRDMIAHGIHRTMNEQANQDAHVAAAAVAAASAPMLGLCLEMERSSNNNSGSSTDHKKPTISVVKNIGGTDTTRFGAAPNVLAGSSVAGSSSSTHNSHGYHQAHMHHHLPHHLSRQEAAALAAGKGTRPKRGKYRNYDRDSLIEAVRAVQRGEMSVHRAGSYFGVPHSTLEYKVKERHLMRPRKREPKPQPGLDGSSSTTTGKSNSNIPVHHNNLSKIKLGNAGNSNVNSKLNEAHKGNSNSAAAAFPTSAPNGIKMPLFDPIQYPAHLFWNPSPAFSQMHMEFNRNAMAAQSVSAAQRYTEEALRGVGGTSAGTPSNANSPSPIASPLSAATSHTLNMKSARELAENLYESAGANGSSILDGIIRKTLDRKSTDVGPPNSASTGGALLDHLLVKKSALPPYTSNNSNDHRSPHAMSSLRAKRAASPLAYTEIKRERGSPPHSSGDDDDDDASRSGNDESSYEHNNNNNSKGSYIGNNELHLQHQPLHHQQHSRSRSRLTSHDSAETDTSSIPSELMTNHNNGNKLTADLNGNGGSATMSGMLPKVEPPLEFGHAPPTLGSTSILQEKLAQIKAEQENEEHL